MATGSPIAYSAAELAWLEKHSTLFRKEMHELFVAKFNRQDVSLNNIIALCKRKKWLSGKKGTYSKGRAIPYSKKELNWLKQNCELPRTELFEKFCVKFDRTDVSKDNIKSLCQRKGWKTGRSGRFEKGNVSWNKGKPMPAHPNSRKTQFKKGHKPHNTKYLGHERLTKDGYVEISVKRTNKHTGYERSYVLKHRYEWEKVNGKVPEGHALKCMDGNKQNCDPSNWELIDRALLPSLTFKRAFDEAENELKPTILAVTKLEKMAEKKRKK